MSVDPATNSAETVPPDAQTAPRAEPVAERERIEAVDALRGVALLGILTMNIVAFSWPEGGYDNPRYSGGTGTANVAAWAFNQTLFAGKMMSLFSMLFGAGLVLMNDRAAARGASLTRVYYRRVLWLLVIGLAHAYLIWYGDILVPYAVCGLFLYFFRNKAPRTLIALGSALVLLGVLLGAGLMSYGRFARDASQTVAALRAEGRTPPEWKVGLAQGWDEGFRAFAQPSPEELEETIATYRGGYPGIVKERAPTVFMFQTVIFLLNFGWEIAGRMLIGMGLMKLGVFSARRSPRFYRRLAALGYGAGLPLTLFGLFDVLARHDLKAIDAPWGLLAFGLGMVPMALGHTAVVMLAYQSGTRPEWMARLAAVGRMALTNYLMTSLICTTLFYGYGFGLFAKLDRPALWLVVLAVWALQLWLSPIWLRRFRFGPAEWLWRALTYGTWPPLRVRTAPAPAATTA